MIPWLNLSSCEDGCCLFRGKVFNRTISKHMSNGIATITTSARAESVRVSPILAKTTLGGQTQTLRVPRCRDMTVWAAVGGTILSVVAQIVATKILGEGIGRSARNDIWKDTSGGAENMLA